MSKAKNKDIVTIKPPKTSAAGVTAVAVALRHATRQMGLAQGAKSLLKLNQRQGFDCPGCAWPDPLGPRKTFEFCENGAKALADEATRRRVDPAFFARWSLADLKQQSGQWLNAQGRLTHPMVLTPGSSHYRPLSWEQAYRCIATALHALEDPDQAAFYTSGRTSNEAAFLYQLLVRKFGTNNLPDCSNMCHESSGVALVETIGSGKGTVLLEDFDHSDAIFVCGQNPGSNHPRMLSALQRAKRNGATIVSINPLDETGLRRFKNPQEITGVVSAGTALADLKLRVKVNGDVPLIKGIVKHMLELDASGEHVLDLPFITRYTHGFGVYRRDIEATSWDDIVRLSGVAKVHIVAAAAIAARSKATICCWAMGLTQHRNAVDTIQEIINLLLLRGNFGRPGAGACPVRGHSNVQGDRTMGIWERPSMAFLDALQKEFDFAPPREHGFNTIEAIQAMQAGRLRVFVAMGGNFARATPDTQSTARALANCDLTVQISTKLNESHLYGGRTALILPALGRSERDQQNGPPQFITTENSMGVVQKSAGARPPLSAQMKSEVRLVAELAEYVLGATDGVDWAAMAADYNRIRDRIAHVIPGFEHFNHRLAEHGHIVLPHAVRDQRIFATATGKAIFTVHPTHAMQAPPDRFVMTTLRTHDQFNTTVYSDNDRYRGVYGSRRVLFMHPDDMASHHFTAGQAVDIASHSEGQVRQVTGFTLVAYDIPRGCVASYYPETNDLIPLEAYAAGSMTPAYKSIVVSVQASV